MVDSRFAWGRVTQSEGVIELKKRVAADAALSRRIAEDSKLNCWVCKKRPRRGDSCYYPARGTSTSNKVIAHADCIEQAYAKIKSDAAVSPLVATVMPSASIPMPAQANLVSVANVTDPLTQLDKIRQEIWTDGYNAGLAAALAKLKGLSNESTSPNHKSM